VLDEVAVARVDQIGGDVVPGPSRSASTSRGIGYMLQPPSETMMLEAFTNASFR
jgi:hypothetical protein